RPTSTYSTALACSPRSPLFPYTTLFRSRLTIRGRPRQSRTSTEERLGQVQEGSVELAERPFGPGSKSTSRMKWRSGKEETMRSGDRKSTRLNSSHVAISYAVFCLKKKKR